MLGRREEEKTEDGDMCDSDQNMLHTCMHIHRNVNILTIKKKKKKNVSPLRKWRKFCVNIAALWYPYGISSRSLRIPRYKI